MAKLLLFLLCLLPLTGVAQQPGFSADSVAPAYRYVNASSLTLRTQPATQAPARALIGGASRVLLLSQRLDGWSQVRVSTYAGYVRTAYLVEEQSQVTADLDWAGVEAGGGAAYQHVSLPTSSPRASPKSVSSPRVYICGNGRTQVYHSSEDCAAMRRCTYQTLVMSQREAQASGLRGCLKCN